MADANELQAILSRLMDACDKAFEAAVDLQALGGLEAALEGRRPKSRTEALARLRAARNQLDGLLRRERQATGTKGGA